LQAVDHNFTADHTNIILHKEVSLKVSLFAWHFLHNSLPTTNNLIKRRALQPDVQLSAGGCGNQKEVDHPFLSCEFFRKIWIGISSWLDIHTVHSARVTDQCNSDH